jgi:hypothetical protein
VTTFVYEEDPPVIIGELQKPAKPAKAPFRGTAKVLSIFQEAEIDRSSLSEAAAPGTVISLNDQTNRSLALAERSNFFGMCKASLLGNESEQEFGEMLRGLVLTFTPVNEYHLHVLSQIADVQWQLRRAVHYRKGLFDANSDQRNASGMNLGTEKAFEYNAVTRKLTEEQHRLVDLYNKVKAQR